MSEFERLELSEGMESLQLRYSQIKAITSKFLFYTPLTNLPPPFLQVGIFWHITKTTANNAL